MNKTKLIITLFLFVSCSNEHLKRGTSNLSGFIVWDESERLDYIDFEANNRPLLGWDSFSVASCASLLHLQPNFNFKYILNGRVHEITVLSLFDKKNSWIDNDYLNNETLDHEQLHFDITEIVARDFRKNFSNKTKPILLDDLEGEFEQAINKLRAMQSAYDTETGHGTKPDKQLEWKIKISNELKRLSGFSEKTVNIEV